MMMLMSENAVLKELQNLPDWEEINGTLRRSDTLPSFAHALLWINAVGQLSEAAGHHPDLHLHGYNHVTIELTTHSANGLTEKDFALAHAIDWLPQMKGQA
jgi:4a-hydroxytetrahydrobiopterin dehydratase